jgi:microcystin-dependent protein
MRGMFVVRKVLDHQVRLQCLRVPRLRRVGTFVTEVLLVALCTPISSPPSETTYGAGDGVNTFNLPNLKGRVPVGADPTQTEFDVLGETGGEKTHLLTAAEMPTHSHTQDSHTHTQTAHTHVQNSHSHTQNAHNHTQDAHGHAQSNAAVDGFQGYVSGVAARARVAAGTTTSPYAITAPSTNIDGIGYTGIASNTATNQSTTATSNAATATSNNTTATNNSTTATNQATGGGGAHNNLQPYVVLNYIIKT